MTLPHRIEAAEGPDRALDAEIARLVGAPHGPKEIVHYESRTVTYIDECAMPYSSSVDAALTLVPEGWGVMSLGADPYEEDAFCATVYNRSKFDKRKPWPKGSIFTGGSFGGIALALCAAAIRAKEISDGE